MGRQDGCKILPRFLPTIGPPIRCSAISPAPQGAPLSAMQVRDSEGRWQDVQLGEHEVAVCCGATLQHATAGLLRPAVHRVVGQPYGKAGGSGRRVLHFELRPRPAAVLDLRGQLEAAGHTVSARWAVCRRFMLIQSECMASKCVHPEGCHAFAYTGALVTSPPIGLLRLPTCPPVLKPPWRAGTPLSLWARSWSSLSRSCRLEQRWLPPTSRQALEKACLGGRLAAT